MSISESQLASLRSFGYTEVEARFLHLVATHSGYFTVPQFLAFARAKSGKRNAQLVAKLLRLGHARGRRHSRRSILYHLGSRQIYEAIGRAHLRNRRDHKLGYIQTRLMALDFILAYPDNDYFEMADEKRRYFVEHLKVSGSLFVPSDEHRGISFSDRFPLSLSYSCPENSPVVTFTYIDPEHRNLDSYIAHLRSYRPLFRQLAAFQFVYVSTQSGFQKEAATLFQFLIEGTGLSNLCRYFEVRTKWDNKQYGLVMEGDLIFLGKAKQDYGNPLFETLYRLWHRNQLPNDLRPGFAAPVEGKQRMLFRAATVPGHAAIFGESTRRWGDAWPIQRTSHSTSSSPSPRQPTQTLQRTQQT